MEPTFFKVMMYRKTRKIIVHAGCLAISLLVITACHVRSVAESSRLIENATVTDVDGNIYTTIQVGNQIWMAENLRTSRYSNGDPILNVQDGTGWANLDTGAWCWYNNDSYHNEFSGRLYNWHAVGDQRNICPEGWFVPEDIEWQVLVDSLGGYSIAGSRMKAANISLNNNGIWEIPADGILSESGFNAVLSGFRSYEKGEFFDLGKTTYFWSSTRDFSITAWGRGLNRHRDGVIRDLFVSYPQENGFAVRCLKYAYGDAPSVSLNNISDITSSTASAEAEIISDGGITVIGRGVCWSTDPEAVSDTSNKSNLECMAASLRGSDIFKMTLIELSPGTTYYINSYATNRLGITYSEAISFTTTACDDL